MHDKENKDFNIHHAPEQYLELEKYLLKYMFKYILKSFLKYLLKYVLKHISKGGEW